MSKNLIFTVLRDTDTFKNAVSVCITFLQLYCVMADFFKYNQLHILNFIKTMMSKLHTKLFLELNVWFVGIHISGYEVLILSKFFAGSRQELVAAMRLPKGRFDISHTRGRESVRIQSGVRGKIVINFIQW